MATVLIFRLLKAFFQGAILDGLSMFVYARLFVQRLLVGLI